MLKINIHRFSVCFALALISAFTLLFPRAVQARKGARILLVNSNHLGFKWTDNIVSGVKSALRQDDDLRIEYLDTRRIYTKSI